MRRCGVAKGRGRICTQTSRVCGRAGGKQWSSSAVCVRSFVTKKVRTFSKDALLIALIALVCVGAVALAGTKVSQVFTNIAGQIPAGT